MIEYRSKKSFEEYGLCGIKNIGNKEKISENLVMKLKAYENEIEETISIIEKVGSDGTNENQKIKKISKNNKNNRTNIPSKRRDDFRIKIQTESPLKKKDLNVINSIDQRKNKNIGHKLKDENIKINVEEKIINIPLNQNVEYLKKSNLINNDNDNKENDNNKIITKDTEENLFITKIDFIDSSLLKTRASNLMNKINNKKSNDILPNIFTIDNKEINKQLEFFKGEINLKDELNNNNILSENNKNNINEAINIKNKFVISSPTNVLPSLNNQSTEASLNNLKSFKDKRSRYQKLLEKTMLKKNLIKNTNTNTTEENNTFDNIENTENTFSTEFNQENKTENLTIENNFSENKENTEVLKPEINKFLFYKVKKREKIIIDSLKPPKKLIKYFPQKKSYQNIIESISKDIDLKLESKNTEKKNDSIEKITDELREKEKEKDKSKINEIKRNNFDIQIYNIKNNKLLQNNNLNEDKISNNILIRENIFEHKNSDDCIDKEKNKSFTQIKSENILKSPISFIDKFNKKCSNEIKSSIKIKKDIKKQRKKKIKFNKDDINILREKKTETMSKAIDKKVYFMDSGKKSKDRMLILHGSEGKDGKPKYLFEDRNNPICVGDSLSILNDKFAYKCKELFSNKYIEDKDDINKRNSVELQNIIRKQIELDKTHDEIEIILNSVERKNLLSHKRADMILNSETKLL